jgi:formyltetrahydrofolate-dependent phosphoribosylglycinamide formyltransferase
MVRLAVLISGSGTNLQALIDACERGELPGVEIAVVVSNRHAAYGLERARRHGLPTLYHPLAPYRQQGRARAEYDADLARILQEYGVDWVVQAGWMHVFSSAFLERFPNRVLNLHPALPGRFPGMHAIARAYEAAQRGEIDHTGVMVHLVPDEAVDAGPVVISEEVPILPEESLDALEARIHAVEHRLLVEAVRRCVEGRS